MLCLLFIFAVLISISVYLKKIKVFKKIYAFYLAFLWCIYIFITAEYDGIFGNIVCRKDLDNIQVKLINISGWQISHFLTFLMVGILTPNYYLLLYFSILWEVFEHIYGELSQNKLYWTSSGYNGQLKDIICNVLGFYLGKYVNKHFI